MPQQLIYTSAPRGVIAGRSGHCTVARSTAMREALMLQLEKLSYYQHLSLSGGQERPIYCCRLLDIRGSRYHVLTRIQDAGLDFTGRTNFLAHHLVFAPEEIRQFASPPTILRSWTGWVNAWNQEPELFNNEDWSSLTSIPRGAAIPALHWQQITGDAANGYGLLEARAGAAFRVDDLADEQVLALFAESLELLELRDPRRDFRSSAWQYTFTTSMQEQDNPADFRWRCLHSDNPAANRFAGPDCRALSEVRAARGSDEEALFARSGRQPPRFVQAPQNVSSSPGDPVRLRAKAEGVPAPAYQWFTVDRTGNSHPITNATSEELVVPNPPMGVTRYAVRASNSEGGTMSDAVALSVEQKGGPATVRPVAEKTPPPTGAPPVKSAGDIERQRQRLEAEKTQQKQPARKWPFIILGLLFLIGIAGALALQRRSPPRPRTDKIAPQHDTNAEVSNLAVVSNKAPKEMVPKPVPFQTENKPITTSNQKPFALLASPSELSWPAEWIQKSIGSVPYHHADCITNSPTRFNLSTACAGIGSPNDNLFFVYQTNTSDDFQASLTSAPNDFPMPPRSARGIMLRDSDSPKSALLFIGADWGRHIFACCRDARGALFFTNVVLAQLPVILKFERRDNRIAATYSFDHRTWMSFDGYELPLRKNALVGFAAWSGDNSNRVTARFVLETVKRN